MEAWTGIAVDNEEDREVPDRSWIMLNCGEPISGADVVSSGIRVVDNRVVRVLHSRAAEGASEAVTTANLRPRLYVRLARPLKADETPEVLIEAGALQDIAGNANDSQVIIPKDGIAPGFTVRVLVVENGVEPDFTEHSIVGATAARPLANGKQSFVVDVTADEELAERPVVYFTGIRADDEGKSEYTYAVGENVQRVGALFRHDEELHWRRTYAVEDLSGFAGLLGLVVVCEDTAGNTRASSGWMPARQRNGEPPALRDPLDLKAMDKAKLLLEIDRTLNGGIRPQHDITFRRHDDEESEVDLFVRFDFAEEGKEYARGGFKDSHNMVTIIEITLDGDDAMPLLTRLNGGEFELRAHYPGESHHDVEYRARDEAGNERFFDVHVHLLGAPEPPYEVDLSPGWNLISLPGTPENPALAEVVPSNGLITLALSYQQGDWRTAFLDANGSWRGRLEEVVGGYGYWLFSIASQTIAALIPDQEEQERLPSVPVTHGWNLLDVLDLFRNPAGEPPGPQDGNGGEADDYFGSMPWRTAYAYDTPRNRWVRLIPKDDDPAVAGGEAEPPEIVNGRGHWVWSAAPGMLLP